MGILLSCIYTLLFILLIYRMKFFRVEGLSRKTLSGILILKIFFGVLVWAIYTYYYTDRSTADIYKYFDDSKVMYNALYTHPIDFFKMFFGLGNETAHFSHYYSAMNNWIKSYDNGLFNDNHTIIRFNALLRIFSFGHYGVHTVFVCFLSLMGLTGIYKAFVPYLQDKKRLLLIAVFLVPSVLFWGSGVLKESLLITELGLITYLLFVINKKGASAAKLLALLLLLFLLAMTRFYVFVVLLPVLIAGMWAARGNARHAAWKYLMVLIGYVALGLGFSNVAKGHDPLKIIVSKQGDFINLAKGGTYLVHGSVTAYLKPGQEGALQKVDKYHYRIRPGTSYSYWKKHSADTIFVKYSRDTITYRLLWQLKPAGSRISINRLKPTLFSFIKNAPLAFLNVLLRPTLLDGYHPMILGMALENTVLLLVILLCVAFGKPIRYLSPLFWYCITFTFLYYLIIGYVTPILGAIVRYRAPAVPFLLIAFLLMLDMDKLLRKFPFLKKWMGKN